MAEKQEIKAQKFMRLIAYAGPYKFRLTVGILAGLVASSSLFGSLLLIPKLMTGIEPEAADGRKAETVELERADRIIDIAEKTDGQPKEERVRAVATELGEESRGLDIEKEVKSWKDAASGIGINLPVEYSGGAFRWNWLVDLRLQTEYPDGRMHWQFFSIFVIGFIFFWFMKNLGTYINRYFTRWVGTRVVADLRNEVFRKLMGQSLKSYGRMDVGQLISRCTNDTAAIETAVAHTIADATRCPLEILACAAAIIYASVRSQNYSLPVILFIGLPLAVLPLIILGRRIRRIYQKAFAKIAEVITRMHEVFTGILVVKAYNMEDAETERFRQVNRKYFRTVVGALKTELLMAPAMEVVAVSATLVFFLYSYHQGVTLTELASLLAPAFLAYMPLKKLAKIRTYMQRSMAAADRYFDLIDMDTGLPEKPDAADVREFRDSVELKDVSFSYEPGSPVLENFNLRIPRGSIVAVVGETGSGKTTIANLIARFYDVDSGSVSIDGRDVRDISTSSLRKLIGIVSQNTILFNDTIAGNIAYGRPEAPIEEVVEAAKQANAHSFITEGKHTKGYDTVVGEKGFKLSGGEKQRVSIARAILKNPPILILDEATSALDTVTERLVQEALDHLMRNRTVFAIAHRLSTIKHADSIVVLDNGSIVESGTHEDLLEHGGIYKKLHDMQFGINKMEN